MSHTIPATWMRGGTSKCWVFEREHLEVDGMSRDDLLLRLFGSPDARQLDGIGGATSTTSKAVILSRSADEEVDVDYTFAQVGIEEARVDWGSNCGNCSAVVAPFALDHGWVLPQGEETVVRVRNTNTDQVIWQRVPTPGGVWEPRHDTTIPGVAFPGIAVGLGFVDPVGRTTGALLPTGRPIDGISVADETVEASLVDAGAPLVILSSASVGLDGLDHDEWTHAVAARLSWFDAIRRAGAVAMGIAESPSSAERAIPKLAVVGPGSAPADLDVLMLSMGQPHPALAITGSVGLTVAAGLGGSVVAAALASGPAGPEGDLRLRTPAGIVSTWRRTLSGEDVVGTMRTARVIAHARIPVGAPAAVGTALSDDKER